MSVLTGNSKGTPLPSANPKITYHFNNRSLSGQGDQTTGSNTIPISGKLQSNLLKVLDKGGEGSFSIPSRYYLFLYQLVN